MCKTETETEKRNNTTTATTINIMSNKEEKRNRESKRYIGVRYSEVEKEALDMRPRYQTFILSSFWNEKALLF